MNTLDQEALDRVHQMQLACMDKIHEICMKHGLSYFLDSGTALGAIRHQGFIPWDDDIDIGMMREDYERFLRIAPAELGDKYFIQTKETEPLYYNFHAKIRIEGTVYPQDYNTYYKHRGIQLDLFPFDYLPENRAEAKKYIKKTRKLRKLNSIRETYQYSQNPVKRIGKKAMVSCFSLLPVEFYRRSFEAACRKYQNTQYVTCFSYRMAWDRELIFNVDDILPVRPIPFEGREYRIMRNPDAFLSEMFGNYMTLPPEKDRVCHVNGKILFE